MKVQMALSSELNPIVNLNIQRKRGISGPNLDPVNFIEPPEIPDKIDNYNSILKTITRSMILKNNRII